MPESLVQVTEGTGKKLHTWQRTIGANNVEDEVILHGEPYHATYSVVGGSVSTATSTSHLLQIMAGASLNVYVRRIWVYQVAMATAAAIVPLAIIRLSTAGTGGSAVGPVAYDTSDSAPGATAMTLPTVKGTEGSFVSMIDAYMMQTIAASAPMPPMAVWDFSTLRGKALRIPAGAANGICISNRSAIAGATVRVVAEITEANF